MRTSVAGDWGLGTEAEDQNRKTNDCMRNSDVYGPCFKKHL